MLISIDMFAIGSFSQIDINPTQGLETMVDSLKESYIGSRTT